MSATQETCYLIKCDGCGDDMPSGEFTEHWPSLEEGRKSTADCYDWWSDGKDVDLCDDCRTWPHPQAKGDEVHDDYCTRCSSFVDRDEEDDHPASAPVVPNARRVTR